MGAQFQKKILLLYLLEIFDNTEEFTSYQIQLILYYVKTPVSLCVHDVIVKKSS